MPKLRGLLPNIFTNKSTTQNENATQEEGRLETDALPVDDNEQNSNNGESISTVSINNTPTASADLTASVVRELSDPNYNSMEVVHSATVPAMVNNNVANQNHTSNTMNVHSAQQQVVMNFSNASNLHFGSVYNFNQGLSKTSSVDSFKADGAGDRRLSASACSSKGSETRKTTSIVAMMQSQEEPDVRLLDVVATHLGEGWKHVMRRLGRSEGQIDQAIIDHQMHGNIKEVIYQLLLQWLRSADDGVATVGNLTTLLWEEHRECVHRMKLVWKAIQKRKTSS